MARVSLSLPVGTHGGGDHIVLEEKVRLEVGAECCGVVITAGVYPGPSWVLSKSL